MLLCWVVASDWEAGLRNCIALCLRCLIVDPLPCTVLLLHCRSLEQFGNGFLTKFQGAQLDVPLLQHITLVDTPGVLSGEKQRIGRSYDFVQVCEWCVGQTRTPAHSADSAHTDNVSYVISLL